MIVYIGDINIWTDVNLYRFDMRLWEVYQMRDRIILACTDCKQRNYVSKKNKKNTTERVELKKYCKFCNAHTVHRETK